MLLRLDDGIVVVRGRAGKEGSMEIDEVSVALQGRLGAEATGGLLQLLDHSHREARDDVIVACTERFERRLVEEMSSLRVQIAQVEATLRGEMAAGRVEFIKWSFIFWIGQVLAMIGMVSILLRPLR
ncbi:MAG TPA: hypothetical protein VNJ03_02235 [Vicinamibacterales bacterium]|nr:hypothetical protein [Vicinamibacterales bacterium]